MRATLHTRPDIGTSKQREVSTGDSQRASQVTLTSRSTFLAWATSSRFCPTGARTVMRSPSRSMKVTAMLRKARARGSVVSDLWHREESPEQVSHATRREVQRLRSQSCIDGGRSPGREEARTCLWHHWWYSVLSSSHRRRLRLLQRAQLLYQPPKAGMPANRRGASTASEPWPADCVGFPNSSRSGGLECTICSACQAV
jgi:hypothetical protein